MTYRLLSVSLVLLLASLTTLSADAETFVARSERDSDNAVVTLRLQSSARVSEKQIRVGDIAALDGNVANVDVLLDVPVTTLSHDAGHIEVADVRRAIAAAGLDRGRVNIVGSTSCIVSVAPPRQTSLAAWAAGDERNDAANAAPRTPPRSNALRDAVAAKLGVAAADLELALPEQPRPGMRLQDVRQVGDSVMLDFAGAAGERQRITARVRIWQMQLVVTQPLNGRQVLQEGDVEARRVAVTRPMPQALTDMQQAIGQQAVRPLRVGDVLSARDLKPQPLVRSGQAVTVICRSGGVVVTSIMTAGETGSFGQAIRVRNEQTRQTFRAVVTGPQQATLAP